MAPPEPAASPCRRGGNSSRAPSATVALRLYSMLYSALCYDATVEQVGRKAPP